MVTNSPRSTGALTLYGNSDRTQYIMLNNAIQLEQSKLGFIHGGVQHLHTQSLARMNCSQVRTTSIQTSV